MDNQPIPTRQRVREMHHAGLTVRQIAAALNVSTQNVNKHLRKLEREGVIPRRDSAA